ncbi:MAG: fatty acid desaturase family protein [Nevskiales bacterium]
MTTRFGVNLSDAQIEEFGREVDAIRDEVFDSRGERDRQYILKIIRTQRVLALGGRVVMFLSIWLLPAIGLPYAGWPQLLAVLGLGAALLGLAKIIENMEIGHNVMHAQWDWMKDPEIQSSTWEWDNVCRSDQWMHSHNVVHHTWTNVIGKDPDVGYGVLRVSTAQRWRPKFLAQPLVNILLCLFFQWGVGAHDILFAHKTGAGSKKVLLRRFAWKAWRQVQKDYLLWPAFGALLTALACWAMGKDASTAALPALGLLVAGSFIANTLRNVWTNVIIFCGHFPQGVHHFRKKDVEGETRAQWYVRQLLGSCNIGGGKLFHILSGNLSHQIEHHLYPDMCSNRYPEVAPRIRALASRYGLPYNTGSLARQYGTTTWTIWRLAFPGGG